MTGQWLFMRWLPTARELHLQRPNGSFYEGGGVFEIRQQRRLFVVERRNESERSASFADKPGRDGLDTRPEGKEVVEMKGEGWDPRRHICHHYSQGACRAWEPYLSPPQNSILPTHPPSISTLRLPGWCLLCLALMAFFSHLFPQQLYHLDSCSQIFLSLPVFLLCCVVWCCLTLALTLLKSKIIK